MVIGRRYKYMVSNYSPLKRNGTIVENTYAVLDTEN